MSRRPGPRRTQHAVQATASEWARIRELAAASGWISPGTSCIGRARRTHCRRPFCTARCASCCCSPGSRKSAWRIWGLEDRRAVLGDAVDAWLDRGGGARPPDRSRCGRAVAGGFRRRRSGGRPRAAVLSDGRGRAPHAALHPGREGGDQRASRGARHVGLGLPGRLRAARGRGRAPSCRTPAGAVGEEQRTLYDRVEAMERVRRALHEALPGSDLSLFGAIAFLRRERDSRRSGGPA